MPEPTVTHETIRLERDYPVAPAKVFEAFADAEVKARWFGVPGDWTGPDTAFDFRVGGHDYHAAEMDGQMHVYDGVYRDIVSDRRIVFAYDMHVGGTRISVSLATVELHPSDTGTRLTYTEQGAFLDGMDSADGRRNGMGSLLDALGALLAASESRPAHA